ncbi:MAG: prolipoprotein diacylglyceryl transferase family protein, partial [Patescibacteria group bacterium]|nr:prolipoprotein diacylglyceryl transferase family protein [Patescibacteria group bacterium]
MRQTLLYIPSHLAGMPVFGVGLLLLVWFLLSVGLLALLARQGRLKEELTSFLLILIPMGLAIVYLLPLLSEPRGLPIRSYGMMMLLAVVSGTSLAAWRAKRAGYEPDLIYSLAFWTFIPGIMGARAFYVIEYWGDKYWPIYQVYGLQSFLGSLVNVAEGGLVVYGSFFGAAVGFVAFVRKYKLPVLVLGDLVAPSLMLGLALGRVGCLLNGCCYGGPCEHAWAVTFPAGSPPHVHQAQRGQIPLQGVKLEPDVEGRPAVAEVESALFPAGAKLVAGDVLRQINGIAVDTVDSARWALLDAPRLNLLILAESDSLAHWLMELPPAPTEVLHAAPDGQLTL